MRPARLSIRSSRPPRQAKSATAKCSCCPSMKWCASALTSAAKQPCELRFQVWRPENEAAGLALRARPFYITAAQMEAASLSHVRAALRSTGGPHLTCLPTPNFHIRTKVRIRFADQRNETQCRRVPQPTDQPVLTNNRDFARKNG